MPKPIRATKAELSNTIRELREALHHSRQHESQIEADFRERVNEKDREVQAYREETHDLRRALSEAQNELSRERRIVNKIIGL